MRFQKTTRKEKEEKKRKEKRRNIPPSNRGLSPQASHPPRSK
jgi:hypothetical protein